MAETEATYCDVLRRDGLSIRCVIERPHDASRDSPLVIVVPPYGKTIREVLVTSLYLKRNGFTSWRFDFCNHLGASEGEIFNFRLSSAIEDVNAVVDAGRKHFARHPLAIISSSLGARVALRALRSRNDVRVLLSLVGVVNVQQTLRSILGEDLIADLLKDRLVAGSRDVLGYQVSTNFLNDAVTHDLYSLESTRRDVDACSFPVVNIAAESDAWNSLAETEKVFCLHDSQPPRETYLLPGVSHKLENNPSAARNALRQSIKILKYYLADKVILDEDIKGPRFLDIVEKNRQERELEKSGYRVVPHLEEIHYEYSGNANRRLRRD